MWLLWFFLIPSVLCEYISLDRRCVTAVFTAYNYLTFSGPVGFWDSRCQNPLKVTSIYAASDIYCRPDERTAGFALFASYCHQFGQTDLLLRDQLAANLTDDAIQQMKVVEYGVIPKHQPLDAPVLISQNYFKRTFRTIEDMQFVSGRHRAYGLACYLYWGVVLAVGTLCRLVKHSWKNRRLSGQPWTCLCTVHRLFQTYLVLPIPRRFLWFTPTPIDGIVLGGFWILNTVLSAISYPTFEGNLYWPPVYKQYLRYVADRTGILSFANLPLLWIFAGRNNIFLWATGWSFATFNIFHRHVAAIATVQAVVHTLLYIVVFIDGGTFWKKMKRPYLLWGTLAMTVMLLLLPMSLAWVRHRTYEVFLIVHIVFSILALVGCFYHTAIFEDLEYWAWLWPAVTIWAVDRCLRLVRLVYCNLHVVKMNLEGRAQCTRSMATYDESSNVVRLQLRPGCFLRPAAGQYYFLYQPLRLTGWESHPFTLGAWSYGPDVPVPVPDPESAPNKTLSVDIAQVPLLSDNSSSGSERDETVFDPACGAHPLQLTFWIRPYDGWTRRLREECLRSADRTTQTRILLEGPYGSGFPIYQYESVLFVVGGTGIAAAIPYIQEHLRRSESASTTTQIREIHLVWTSRQASFIADVAKSELRWALTRDDIRASFYVTNTSSSGLGHDVLGIELTSGRPDLASLVTQHVHEARLSDSSTAVVVCGPPGMATETRTGVYARLRQGHEVAYSEESFSW